MIDTFITLFLIFKTILYLFVGIIFLDLSNIYKHGYDEVKQSNLIRYLHKTFFYTAIMFLYLAFQPVIRYLDKSVFIVTSEFLFVPVLGIGHYARKFLQASFEQDGVSLRRVVAKLVQKADNENK